MNLEQPKEELPHERTAEELCLHNFIQIELMKRYVKLVAQSPVAPFVIPPTPPPPPKSI